MVNNFKKFPSKEFPFFSKYPKYDLNYEYMNEPNMKWNENTETCDTRKTILTSWFTEIETGSKKWTKMLFL